MSGRLPYELRRKYPHMLGEDIPIWERFVAKFPDRFDSVDYDWRVGQGMDLDQGWEEGIKRMATAISQKRIDVVGWLGDQLTIIEVKKSVSTGTLGQILTYRSLFVHEFPYFEIPALLVVCEFLGIDDRTVLEDFKIPIEVV